MAERESQGFLTDAGTFIGGIIHAVSSNREITGAIRQGFNELANAFGQFWPDHIAVVEPGTMFHPLHSDIAASNDHYQSVGLAAEAVPSVGLAENRPPSPSEIVREAANYQSEPQADRGQDHTQSQGHER